MGSRFSRKGPPYWTHIPPADGQPGLTMDWIDDCQEAMDAAIRRVENWFAEDEKSNLWVALFIGRTEQRGDIRRAAYETAFIWRLQQRLASQPTAVLDA